MRRHSVSTVRRGSGRRGVSEESSILGEDRGHKPDVKVGVVDLRGGFHFRVGREDLVRTIAGAFAVAAFGVGGFNLRYYKGARLLQNGDGISRKFGLPGARPLEIARRRMARRPNPVSHCRKQR